jgi:hypothetical protein
MAGSDQPLRRVNYFSGQFLSAQDFQDEQDYFRERHRLHNRLLHGNGVVFGLQVEMAGQVQIVVHLGAALDCQGNELVVPEPVMCHLPEQGKRVYVTLSYAEWLADPVPGLESAAEGEDPAYTRVIEGVQVDLLPKNPARQHQTDQTLPGCDPPRAVVLARLVRKAAGWRLDKSFQPQQARPPWGKPKTTRVRKKQAV